MLIDAKIRASDKDLPVHIRFDNSIKPTASDGPCITLRKKFKFETPICNGVRNRAISILTWAKFW